jgi:hypothetical protein
MRGRLDERGLLFPLSWLAGVITFYSLAAGKRSIYVLAAYPAAALLAGALAATDLPGRAAVRRTARLLGALVLALLVAIVGGAVLLIGTSVDADALTHGLHSQDRWTIAQVIALGRRHRLAATLAAGSLVALLAVVHRALARDRPGVALGALGTLAVGVAVGLTQIVQPAQAARRSLRAFAAEVRARVPPDAELRFVGPPDFGMCFYLGHDVPTAPRPAWQASDPRACRYLLVWKSRWHRMSPEARARLEALAKSAGRGPKGDDRLLLVRARSPACTSDAAPPPLQTAVPSCDQSRHAVGRYRDLGRLARDRAPRHVSPVHRGAIS